MTISGEYPHVRNMRYCVTCGREKRIGLLVCWECHNDFTMLPGNDHGYGVETEMLLHKVERQAASISERMSITKT